MLKTHIAACLMATALVAAPAFAQTGTAPAQPPAAGDTTQPRVNQQEMPAATQGTQPGTTETTVPIERPATDTAQQPPAPATDTAQQPAAGTTDVAVQEAPGADLQIEGGVIVMQSPQHLLVNDLIGVNVIGADDASIGSVKDLVLDAEHRVVGVIVGVGGFLGIGTKNVALPMADLNIVPDVDTTAALGTGEATAREIEEIRVNMTREQLEEAPEFARLDPPAPPSEPAVAPGAPGGMGGPPPGQPQ
jgi:sporulation protein YlmC with PRC-barrel domain